MQPDRNPTFAEALLACAIKSNTICDWRRSSSHARSLLDSAPPEIRRALGVDKQPVVEPRELALEKQLADAQQDARDATTMIAQAHREKASAVARAEKAEAQAAEARDAFTLAVGERDALRAELDKAKAAVAAMEASRDGWCEKATKPPQCEVERPDLETVWTYGDFGWHGAGGLPYCRERAARAETIRIYARALERKAKAMEARLAELDRFDVLGMTGRLDTALRERDALAAKLEAARKALDAKEQP